METHTFSSASSLHGAAEVGDLLGVQMICESPVNVNAVVFGGWCPLHWAARNGHLDVCKYLLFQGASIHLKTISGSTALHYACIEEREDVAIFLAEMGADISVQDNQGCSPLEIASYSLARKFLGTDISPAAVEVRWKSFRCACQARGWVQGQNRTCTQNRDEPVFVNNLDDLSDAAELLQNGRRDVDLIHITDPLPRSHSEGPVVLTDPPSMVPLAGSKRTAKSMPSLPKSPPPPFLAD